MAGEGDNSEFAVLEALFRPLAANEEARGLIDDVAALPARVGYDLIVTTDAMVEGVHFLKQDPPDQVAQKLLRVNLSDLAAKGAEPYGYQLTIAWPKGTAFATKQAFVEGLKRDQAAFGLKLFGGDTVSTPGPLTLSVTLFGYAPSGSAPSRSGAKAGDGVWVSGPIGDGWLGLQVLTGALALPEVEAAAVTEVYRRPVPRLDMADAVRLCASASLDVSDGLIADAGHIARASGVQVHIEIERVPFSAAGQAAVAGGIDPLSLVTGGDDYQVLCTASPESEAAMQAAGFYRIGDCVAGDGVVRFYRAGVMVEVASGGWVHGG